jgi:4'-phosphopantetheinyl transferase
MFPLVVVPLPPECPADVSLWRIDIAFDARLDDPMFASLSGDERTRAQAFHRSMDALRFAMVRAALRTLLAERLGIAAEDVPFASDEAGRPSLANSHAIDFNVSHSGDHGLIALSSRRRVGVDIEERATRFDWRTVAEIALSPHERDAVERLAAHAQTDAFYDIWVTKEAILKALGVGITKGMQHFTVWPRRDDVQGIASAPLSMPPGYAACIAWSAAALRT